VSAARELTLGPSGAPPGDDGAPSLGPDASTTRRRSAIVIGRYQQTVVVTVHGELDSARAVQLGDILADLIDGQGNLSLLVDLHDATAADAEPLSVFTDADERARRRGGAVTLSKPPAPLHQALRELGLGHLVGALDPGRGADPAPQAARGSERPALPAAAQRPSRR
jgi:anti-anti-sigma factor